MQWIRLENAALKNPGYILNYVVDINSEAIFSCAVHENQTQQIIKSYMTSSLYITFWKFMHIGIFWAVVVISKRNSTYCIIRKISTIDGKKNLWFPWNDTVGNNISKKKKKMDFFYLLMFW